MPKDSVAKKAFSNGCSGENDRKHIVLCVWRRHGISEYSMAHMGIANKHETHRILLEDGSLQRRTQGNDLDTPTDSEGRTSNSEV